MVKFVVLRPSDYIVKEWVALATTTPKTISKREEEEGGGGGGGGGLLVGFVLY